MTIKTMASPGQYLTIVLGTQTCAITVTAIREINQVSEITPIPNTPKFVRGVINLRGKIVPVVDLKHKFGMSETGLKRGTCIAVIECDHGLVGVLVDEVKDMVELKQDEIEPSPNLGDERSLSYLMGIGKVKDKVLVLIDVTHALSREQFLKDLALNLEKMVA